MPLRLLQSVRQYQVTALSFDLHSMYLLYVHSFALLMYYCVCVQGWGERGWWVGEAVQL